MFTIIVVLLTIVSFVGVVALGIHTYLDSKKRTPADELFDLDWKVRYSVLGKHSEKYLKEEIEKLRKRKDINQNFLNSVEDRFKIRFEIDNDEFDPNEFYSIN
jgi:hypothetical protein